MKYRICFGIVFVFFLLFLPFASTARAVETWEDSWNPDITYEFDAATGTITLSGTGEITISRTASPWGNYPKDVKKIVIGEGITSIGASTFSILSNLTEVVLPESLTNIGRSAFMSCPALKTIDLSRITAIGDYAFYGCFALTAVDISRTTSLGQYAFQDTGLLSITIPETITVIPRSAFYSCSNLSELILHDQITEIGYDAFHDCHKLTSVRIPKGLKVLDSSAFKNCSRLTDIQLNDGLEIIGNGAFGSCTGLTTLIIPDTVHTIGDYAFSSCTNLQSIHFGAGLSSISHSVFISCPNLNSITISENAANFKVHNNGLYKKEPCELVVLVPGYVGEYVIPEGTVAIGHSACNNRQITAVTIPDTVKIIGEYAFSDCKKLTTVSLGDGIEEIKTAAFVRSGITEITIPASVKKISGGIFRGCTNFTKIVFQGPPPEVSRDIPEKGDVDLYYPGYMPEWKNANVNNLGYYFNYIPDCHGRHDLRWEIIKAPTCTEEGLRSETWCIVCRQTVDSEDKLEPTGHSYGAWTTVTSPTTEKTGVSKRVCSNCGVSEQKTIPKLTSSPDAPAPKPSTPPEADSSQPSTDVSTEPPFTEPSAPSVISPSVPKQTAPATSDLTEATTPDDPAPAHWISVITVAVASILIGMVISFLVFTFKKRKENK